MRVIGREIFHDEGEISRLTSIFVLEDGDAHCQGETRGKQLARCDALPA
jgi:hypothetical protein